MLHLVDLSDGQIVSRESWFPYHLSGKAFEQLAIALNGLLEGSHDLRANQMLGRDNVMQIVSQRLFQHITLGLAVLPRYFCEFFPQLGVNLRGNLLGCSRHCIYLPTGSFCSFSGKIQQNLDEARCAEVAPKLSLS